MHPNDPVNEFDLSGEFSIKGLAKWVYSHSDEMLAVGGLVGCAALTGGACMVAVASTAAVGGVITGAKAKQAGNSWKTAAAKGTISAVMDGAGAKKVKAIRWFGQGRNYKKLTTALSKKADQGRAVALVESSAKGYIVGKARDWAWNKWR